MALKHQDRPHGAEEEDIASGEALSPAVLIAGRRDRADADNDNVAASADITADRLALHANGYRPVPVLGARVDAKGAGKRPVLKDWINVCAVAGETEIHAWERTLPTSSNTGILCGEVVGLDIDVPDDGLATKCDEVAVRTLGAAPCRFGNAPKRLRPYRVSRPFDKLQTPELVLPDGTVGRVEILARGQQFVAFGIHPATRRNYEWNGGSPLDVPVTDLTVVDEEQCAAYLIEVERLLRAAGAETKAERDDRQRAGHRTAGIGADDRPSAEVVEEALGYVPNFDLSYDAWIKVGFALYHGLGAAGLHTWLAWSAQSTKNDPALSETKWASFAAGRSITVGTLFWMAKENGWRCQGGAARRTVPSSMPTVHRDSNRLVIQAEAGALPRVVDDAEAALIAFNAPLYQRGGIIVSPASAVSSAPGKRGNSVPRIVTVNALHIAELMTAAAVWLKFDARRDDWVATDCPSRIAETYLARPTWRLRVLRSIISHPTLREDGTILDQPGYDARTGLLYDPMGAAFPPVPATPTREEAVAARDAIMELFRAFPYVSPADRAVALSGLLTAVVRASLETAPMHAYSAPTAGSGKSLHPDIYAAVTTGRTASVIALGRTEEESEKRLAAALIAGDVLIAIDNVDRPLGGEFLCQILTQQTAKPRLLGESKNVEVPTTALITATGNNLVLDGDMTRRALMCSLDPGVERPEERSFDFHPLDLIMADRGRYVVAALTILRAYHVAGLPPMTKPLGSYETWSRLVRDALVWLGEADPCETMEKARAADPKLESLTAVAQQWARVIGVKRVTAKEIIAAANGPVADLGYDGRNSAETEDFREALLAVAGEGSAVNARRLGKWLARNQGRVVGGMKIVADGTRAGVALWRLDTGAPF